MRPKNPIPTCPDAWLVEIAAAYQQLWAERPRAVLEVSQLDLVRSAPAVALKCRGLRRSQGKLAKASESVLACYLATCHDPDMLNEPHLVFAFSYLASHHGLGMLTEAEASDLMEFVEHHRKRLLHLVNAGTKPNRSLPRATDVGLLRWFAAKWGDLRR